MEIRDPRAMLRASIIKMAMSRLSDSELRSRYGVHSTTLTRDQLISGIVEDELFIESLATMKDEDIAVELNKIGMRFEEMPRLRAIELLTQRRKRKEILMTSFMEEVETLWEDRSQYLIEKDFPLTTNIPAFKLLATYGLNIDGHRRAVMSIFVLGDLDYLRGILQRMRGVMMVPNVCIIDDTPEYRERISRLFVAINVVHDKYVGAKLIKDPPLEKTVGVIGYDIPFDEPDWLKEAVPGEWDSAMNPFREGRRLAFNVCGFQNTMTNCLLPALRSVQVNGTLPFNKIHPEMFAIPLSGMTPEKSADFIVSKIMTSEAAIFLGGWEHHAKIVVKIGDGRWLLLDSWQQEPRGTDYTFLAAAARAGINAAFHAREPEQQSDGSCMPVDIVRAAEMSAHDNVDGPQHNEIIMLVHRLMMRCMENTM